ncbi:MAG: glycosyltransferase family A protein [Pseudomonadota bacterium]
MPDTAKDAQDTLSLSVVLSVYNGEEFVADAIKCILDQTYTDFELICINDGSKDGSLAIMEQFAARDKRVRIIDQDNTGLTIALRRGVDAARGEYIARMDVDDWSMPDRFEKQMALLRQQPELVAVTCDVEHFYDDGTPSHTAKIRKDARVLPLYLVFTNRIGGHGQMIYRRDAYHATGGYDPNYNLAEDYDLWTRLIEQGPFGVVPETLYRYRTGHDSISSRNAIRQNEISCLIRCRQYEKLTGEPLDPEIAKAMYAFGMNRSLAEYSPGQISEVSEVMHHAVNTFFSKNPELKSELFDTRRGFSSNWWWRRDHVTWADFPRKAAILSNVLSWGFGALVAKYLPN